MTLIQHFEANCPFCQIVAGTLPSAKIYEDEETVAFLNILPVHSGHALVIPKDHYENIYSVPPEIWARMALTTQKVALAVKEATDADGINIDVNNEATAGQMVFHSHIHIIPRHENDGLKHWPGHEPIPEEQEAMRQKVQKILAE